MNYATFRAQVAAHASQDQRIDFLRKTYLHLGGAVMGFVVLTSLFIKSSFAPAMMEWVGAGQFNWLILMGAFMFTGWLSQKWAMAGGNPTKQYMGLALSVLSYAVIFVPIMYIAANFSDASVIPKAGLMTALVFGGLTTTVFLTKKDFSFMGKVLMIGGWVAMGLIVTSIIFGFNLGTLFAAGMVALCSGYILYYTSSIMHHYPIGSHVAASLALFGSVAMLFYYILMIFMNNRD